MDNNIRKNFYQDKKIEIVLGIFLVLGLIFALILTVFAILDCKEETKIYGTCSDQEINCIKACSDLDMELQKYERATLGSSPECWCKDKNEGKQIW